MLYLYIYKYIFLKYSWSVGLFDVISKLILEKINIYVYNIGYNEFKKFV